MNGGVFGFFDVRLAAPASRMREAPDRLQRHGAHFPFN